MNDIMRLPPGILSGMGFIGPGAIVRRDNLVTGVTTAATLWFLTVIGLCFGAGQIALGVTGAALGVAVLMGLKLIEDRMKQDMSAELVIIAGPSGPPEDQIRSILQNAAFRISSLALSIAPATSRQRFTCKVQWRSTHSETKVPRRSVGSPHRKEW